MQTLARGENVGLDLNDLILRIRLPSLDIGRPFPLLDNCTLSSCIRTRVPFACPAALPWARECIANHMAA